MIGTSYENITRLCSGVFYTKFSLFVPFLRYLLTTFATINVSIKYFTRSLHQIDFPMFPTMFYLCIHVPQTPERLWLLSIMPSRPVRDKWVYQRKMERHFPIKPRQPIGIALATFLSFPNSLIRAKNRFVKNRTANFDRNIPTEISGPPPEVIPNIPVGRNRNGPFHLNSDRNFRNLWHNGKHPLIHGYRTT